MGQRAISLPATAKRKPRFQDTGHSQDYCSIAWRYAVGAVNDSKQTKHCRWVRLAALRFLRDYRNTRKSWVFDPWHGNDVCDFIEKLPHVEGTWATPEIRLEPAQIFILVCVFGFRKKTDGTRRYSDVYIEMARKGAKSTLTGGISLYCLCCEGEQGPQVIVAATTAEQAGKVFKPAQGMVRKSADLREAFDLTAWSKSITCDQNQGFIQPINSKSSTQDGWNPHLAVTDELHGHKERGLHDVLKSAFGARKNPLMWRITTAGYIVTGVCYEQRTMVTKILDGIIEADHYFGIIYTLDDGDEPLDESKWVKANPMIGITPALAEMRSYAKEAAAAPGVMGEFKTKRLNIWTTSKGGWLNMERWKKLPGNAKLPDDLPIWGGLDLASVSDITALALCWWDGPELNISGRYYLPESAIELRNQRGDFTYKHWQEQGHLIVTPGDRTDYEFIERDILSAGSDYDVQQFGYDPYNATHIVNQLTEQGLPMVEIRQGSRTLHPAMQEFERKMLGNELRHDGNPVLTWAASNVVARRDANNNMAPDKKHSMDKIDPLSAVLNAVVLMLAHQDSGNLQDFLDSVTR
jgi:phage terminase large subunit-like protein